VPAHASEVARAFAIEGDSALLLALPLDAAIDRTGKPSELAEALLH